MGPAGHHSGSPSAQNLGTKDSPLLVERVRLLPAPKLSGPGEILQRAQSLRPLVRRQALASVYKCLRIFQRGRASDRRGLAVSKAIAAFAICYLLTVN